MVGVYSERKGFDYSQLMGMFKAVAVDSRSVGCFHFFRKFVFLSIARVFSQSISSRLAHALPDTALISQALYDKVKLLCERVKFGLRVAFDLSR